LQYAHTRLRTALTCAICLRVPSTINRIVIVAPSIVRAAGVVTGRGASGGRSGGASARSGGPSGGSQAGGESKQYLRHEGKANPQYWLPRPIVGGAAVEGMGGKRPTRPIIEAPEMVRIFSPIHATNRKNGFF